MPKVIFRISVATLGSHHLTNARSHVSVILNQSWCTTGSGQLSRHRLPLLQVKDQLSNSNSRRDRPSISEADLPEQEGCIRRRGDMPELAREKVWQAVAAKLM